MRALNSALWGAALGVVAWIAFRGAQGARVDTADGQAFAWLNGIDDFVDVAYQVGAAVMPGNMQISLNGLNQIKNHEGFRHNVYNDSAGYPTIGYGHKLTAAERLAGLSYVTEQEAARLLAKDVASAEATVNAAVKVPLTQNQYDALVSFVYNVGGGAFRRSTMLRLLNAGDYSAAAGQFARWNKAGGRVVLGLTNRRLAEAELFRTGGTA